jgi:hypothetical protein
MSSMTSKASSVRLGLASFSAVFPLVELMSTDPSQPYRNGDYLANGEEGQETGKGLSKYHLMTKVHK